VLLFLAPISLQRIVNEMTLHPRPASLWRTIAVETDHPLILFSRNTPPWGLMILHLRSRYCQRA